MSIIAIGIMDSSIGGVNKFISDYISSHRENEFVILASGKINEFYKNQFQEKIKIFQITSITKPLNLFSLSKKIFLENNVQQVYLNISTNLFYPVLKAASDCGVKERIVHSHSSYSADENFFKRNLIVFINKILQKKVNKISDRRKACSDKAAKWIFGQNREFEFIYNSVSSKKFTFNSEIRFEVRSKLGFDNFLIIGFVGGFNYQKNTSYFLDIALKLQEFRKDFVIVMLGDGIQKKSFEKKIKMKKLEQYFVLLGNKTDANLYYNAFDCFIMPSRFEGLPYVGIEAQVNGLKCFFSDKITAQVRITEECEFFNLRKINSIVQKLSNLPPNLHKITKLANFNNFVK